jgi:hypothetical protein
MRRMCMNMFLSLLCSWGSPAMASIERVLVVSQHYAATKNASFAGMSPSATTGSGALVREPKLCWAQLPNLHCYSCTHAHGKHWHTWALHGGKAASAL